MTRCERCLGELRNVPAKRHTIERLVEIHAESCPAPLGRTRKGRAAAVLGDAPDDGREAIAAVLGERS